MDILRVTREAYCNYMREHGGEPKVLYLGRKEREALTQYANHNPWHRSMTSDVSSEREKLHGMSIYFVDEVSHINCAHNP